jgi:hypothetical protein
MSGSEHSRNDFKCVLDVFTRFDANKTLLFVGGAFGEKTRAPLNLEVVERARLP